jgi:hypothetical protein
LADVPASVPTNGLMTRLGDPVTAQLSVLALPAVTVTGVAVNFVMVGALPAVTVNAAVLLPKLLVAFSVYDCVVEGVTLTEVPATTPTPGLTVTLGYPVTAQLSVLDCPVVTFAGIAVKKVMEGGLPAITVTEAVADPLPLLAVNV